jgi:hypothetical protein
MQINPQIYQGIIIPYWLQRRLDVGTGAKVVYGVLASLCGGKNFVDADQRLIADTAGLSVRSVVRHTKELQDVGLIKKGGRNSLHTFLYHEWMGAAPVVVERDEEEPSTMYELAEKLDISNPYAFVNQVLNAYPKESVLAGLQAAVAYDGDNVDKIPGDRKWGRYRKFIANEAGQSKQQKVQATCPHCGNTNTRRDGELIHCDECETAWRLQ